MSTLEPLAKIEEVARRSGEPLTEVAEDAAITLVPESSTATSTTWSAPPS